MTLFQKQTFLANYSFLATKLIDIMERAAKTDSKNKYENAKNLVDALNEVYMYTRMLEKEEQYAKEKLKIERNDKLRAIETLRKVRGDE
jgi:nicotinic acid mononucleotide adenylyltransferase